MIHSLRLARAVVAVSLLAGLAACAKPATAVDVTKEAAAINAEDAAINAAIKAKDADAAVKYDADDIQNWASGFPPVTSKADDLAGNKQAFADPNYSFSFSASATTVAASGDIAYQTGAYQDTYTDPATKKAISHTGHWVGTWKKSADGTWLTTAVAAVDDTPGAAAPATNAPG